MNDDFLHRLRRAPPLEFAARLRSRLQLPAGTHFASRFRVRVWLAVLLGGTTLAVASPRIREVASHVWKSLIAVTNNADTSEQPHPDAAFGPDKARSPAQRSTSTSSNVTAGTIEVPRGERDSVIRGVSQKLRIAGATTKFSSDSGSLNALLNANTIQCVFKDGLGSMQTDGKLRPQTAAWGGGTVTFEIVDISEGTARVSGGIDSPAGETDVAITVTNTGLYFSFLDSRGGNLTITGVFADPEVAGRFKAVTSFLGSPDYAIQFYGSCTIGLAKLRTSR